MMSVSRGEQDQSHHIAPFSLSQIGLVQDCTPASNLDHQRVHEMLISTTGFMYLKVTTDSEDSAVGRDHVVVAATKVNCQAAAVKHTYSTRDFCARATLKFDSWPTSVTSERH